MTFVLLRDWMIKSKDPYKVSFMWLRSNHRGMLYDSKNKEQMLMHHQQSLGKESSKDNTESLISCNFYAIEGSPDLEIQVCNYFHFLQEILVPDVVHALKFDGEVHQETKHNERCFKSKLDKDESLVHRFICALEQCL